MHGLREDRGPQILLPGLLAGEVGRLMSRKKVVPEICFRCGQIIAYYIVPSDFRGNVIYSRCDDCKRK
jgi:hypothetical protein